jgi:hypothetical protein
MSLRNVRLSAYYTAFQSQETVPLLSDRFFRCEFQVRSCGMLCILDVKTGTKVPPKLHGVTPRTTAILIIRRMKRLRTTDVSVGSPRFVTALPLRK